MAADTQFLSFHGKASLDAVKAGTVKETVRLGDRSAAPAGYKVGLVVPLVNGDKNEDARKFEEQAAANAYGKIEFVSVAVTKFEALQKKDQDEFSKYYTVDKIKAAGGVVTVLGIKFKN